jgi:hypothetical protein
MTTITSDGAARHVRRPPPAERHAAARAAADRARATIAAAVAQAAAELEGIEDLATRELAAAYAVEDSRYGAVTAVADVRTRALLTMHGEGRSWAQVADEIGISREMAWSSASRPRRRKRAAQP